MRKGFFHLAILVVLVLLIARAMGQSQRLRHIIEDERGLVQVLGDVGADDDLTKEVLAINRKYVTPDLYEKIIRAASSGFIINRERSLLLFKAGVQVALSLGDSDMCADSYYHLGRAYSSAQKIDLAIGALTQSKTYYDLTSNTGRIVSIVGDLASIYLFKQDYLEASRYARSGILLSEGNNKNAPGDYGYGRAMSYMVLGFLKARAGDYGQAVDFYYEAWALFQILDQGSLRYSHGLIEAMSGLGRVNLQMEDVRMALVYFAKAEEIARKSIYLDKIAGVMNDIGVLYLNQEDYEKSYSYFTQSLVAYKMLKNISSIARIHYNLGVTRQRAIEFDVAMNYFRLAQHDSRAVKNIEIMITSGEGISAIYREQGNYSQALEELAESERLAVSIDDRYRLAEIQWLRAKVYQAAGRYEEAVKEANAALSQVEKINARGISYLINTTLGECYLAEKKYEQAQGSFREAIGELEGSRKRIVGAEYERQLFFEQKTAAYHGMVELMLRAERPAEALMYAEKTKARTLVDVLTQGKFNFSGVLTDAERREEKRLNQQIIDLNRSLRNESLNAKPSVEKVNGLTTQLSTARSQLSSFQSRAHSNHPELTAGGTAPGDLQLSELRGVVRSPGTAVLEYVVTEKGVHLFVVTADPVSGRIKIRPHYIAIDRKELVKQVTRFHRSVSERDLVFSGDARLLYDLLVRPAAPDLVGKRVLCVIPDEVLWNIPFQALQGTGDRYLLEDYSLYYAPSLGALKMISPRSTKVAEREFSLLSFANPLVGEKAPVRLEVAQRAGPFAPLPEAEVEANSIRQLFPSGRSRVFVGEAATESSFKAMAAGYKVIHLATHGILDDRHPLYSYVLFSDRDGEENDGMLEAREVVNLDLNADLVVLSACETGRGGIKRGEGVVGLSWAFLAAGAKTTVVSQWKVNSASTARLMVGFYKRMRGQAARPGVTRSEALRQASLDLMKDNRYRHPFYWAGFIIVGRGE